MGKKRRRSQPQVWWKRNVGGMPVWLTAISLAAILGGLGVAAVIGLTREPPASAEPSSLGEAEATGSAAPTETPALALPDDPRLLIVGDSYTQGYAADPETENGWAYRASASLGWPSMIDGVGGTGFTWAGGTNNNGAGTFATRLQATIDDGDFTPNLVVFQGGHNDWRTEAPELSRSIAEAVSLAQAAWPGVQVVIVGPVAGNGQLMNDTSTAMANAAAAANVPFVSPLSERWFDQSSFGSLIIEDGTHLNNEGHAVFADRFVTEYLSLFG